MSESSPGQANEEELMICPSCHTPNPSYTRYCSSCRAPLDSTTMLGPLGQIEAEGFALREATSGRSSPMIVIGVWLFFLPALGASLFFAGACLWMRPHPPAEWFAGFLLPFLFSAYSVVLLYQATVNFVRKNRARKEHSLRFEGR